MIICVQYVEKQYYSIENGVYIIVKEKKGQIKDAIECIEEVGNEWI